MEFEALARRFTVEKACTSANIAELMREMYVSGQQATCKIDIGKPEVDFVISPQEPTIVNIVNDAGIICRINVTDYIKGLDLIDAISQAIGSLDGRNNPIEYMHEETVKLRKTLEDVRGIVEELNIDNQTAYEQGYKDALNNERNGELS